MRPIEWYIDRMYPPLTQKKADEVAGEFLINNGFEKHNDFCYKNDKCLVHIYKKSYEILWQHGTYFTENFNIYHLVGYLTWYGLMDKDYKKYL